MPAPFVARDVEGSVGCVVLIRCVGWIVHVSFLDAARDILVPTLGHSLAEMQVKLAVNNLVNIGSLVPARHWRLSPTHSKRHIGAHTWLDRPGKSPRFLATRIDSHSLRTPK